MLQHIWEENDEFSLGHHEAEVPVEQADSRDLFLTIGAVVIRVNA